MTRHISRNPDLPDMVSANLTESPLVAEARAALARLTEAQRLALAIQMALAASDTSNRLQLRRLSSAANQVSLELCAKALEREAR
jgi:hypothetical protein